MHESMIPKAQEIKQKRVLLQIGRIKTKDKQKNRNKIKF